MITTATSLLPDAPAAPAPESTAANGPLTSEEFAALLAIDGSLCARRPPAALEIRLRRLGLIEPSRLSRLPVRTPAGEALIAAAGVVSAGPLRPEALDFLTVFGDAAIA